jgi:type IV secretory pathway VirB9-like protein
MILSTLLNVATVIAISTSTPTTMIFKEPIQFVSAGKTGDFSLFINNNKKVIVIQPLKDIKASVLVVLTDNKNYQFKIQIEKITRILEKNVCT